MERGATLALQELANVSFATAQSIRDQRATSQPWDITDTSPFGTPSKQPSRLMDAGFSFMHQRSTSSCSLDLQGFQSKKNTVLPQRDRMNTPSSVSRPAPTSTTAAPASSAQHKSVPAARRHRLSFSPSRKSPKEAKQPNVTYARKLPLRLPQPPLALISNPHVDLVGHLRRHGLEQDAVNFEAAPGITVDFALQAFVLQASSTGPAGLSNMTNTFMDKYADQICGQLGAAQEADEPLPRRFSLPMEVVQQHPEDLMPGMLPTHMLAVQGITEGEKGVLIPCHALMYVLQCVSLPAFASGGIQGDVGDGSKHLVAVLPIKVPRPKEFPTLHRFLYTHDRAALLNDLLPMRSIARYCDQQQSLATVDSFCDMDMIAAPIKLPDEPMLNLGTAPFIQPPPPPKTVSNHATEALSYLPVQSLFTLAFRIHSSWANGVAIGFLEPTYWSTLDKAWALVVAALAAKKGRLLDAESRGLNMGMGPKQGSA